MCSSVASSMHLLSLEGNGRSWRRLCNGRYNGLLASPQNCTACALFGVSSNAQYGAHSSNAQYGALFGVSSSAAAAAVSRDRALRHRTVSRRAGSPQSAVLSSTRVSAGLSSTRVSAVLSSTRASACARTVQLGRPSRFTARFTATEPSEVSTCAAPTNTSPNMATEPPSFSHEHIAQGAVPVHTVLKCGHVPVHTELKCGQSAGRGAAAAAVAVQQ